MTTVNLASITNVLQKRFEPDVVSQIQRAAPMLQVLSTNVRDADSHVILWDVKFGTQGAGSSAAIAEGADVTTFNTDTKEAATLNYGTYHEAFEVSGKALAAAAASGNPAAIAALFESEIRDAVQRLGWSLAGEFYNGNGSGERMVGLLGGAILDTGSYAGISRVTYPQWAGTIEANGGVGRDISFTLLRHLSTTVYTRCGMRPGFLVCGPRTHDRYGALFTDQRRYTQVVNGVGGEIKLQGGYRALDFDGLPLLEDVNCPEGMVFMLNLEHLFFKQLPQPGMTVTRSMSERPLETAPEQLKGGGTIALRVRIQPLAVNGDKYRFALYIYPQLQVRRPQAFGILQDLNY